MAIGFHTRRHHVLPTLDDASLAAALQDGRAELETWAGGRVVTIAYPHGKADERVAAAARTAGFEVGFTGEAAGIGSAANPLLLGRHTPSHRSARHLALQIVAALIRVREPVGHSPA
jgi:peptidoglycan/xylan/chitin deacetylase (PgdA/CDA1 family)